MKYIKPKNWTDINNQQGLLFFAQTLSEALFHYTLDTYKPQALNVRLLCIEALNTIDDIKAGLIKKPNIISIIDELICSLNSDTVSKELLGDQLEEIIATINKHRSNLHQLKEVILLLYHYFDNKKYLLKIQEYLSDLVIIGREKGKIYKATRLYLTELINYGYSTGAVYHITHGYFFDPKKNVTTNSPNEFLEILNFSKKKYKVIFRASKHFNEFKTLEDIFKFKISTKLSSKDFEGENKRYIDDIQNDEVYIIFDQVEAFDDNTARLVTETPLLKIGNLFSFYHHKEVPYIHEFALVTNKSDNYSTLREMPIKSIIKKSDIKPNIAAQKVQNLLKLELPTNTIKRIGKAIDLHSTSLTSEQIENKLLSLWTAIEMLIPKDEDSGIDRIVQIANAIVPFQTYKYLNKIIIQAQLDFMYYDRIKYSRILKKIDFEDNGNNIIALASLLMTAENEASRKKVLESLNENPLLKWRLNDLHNNFSSGKNVLKFIEDHKQKVEWQIRRIYRVRNLIVHSGKMPSYTNLLVENLHNYFDDFLNYLIDHSITEKRLKTMDEAILNCKIECNILEKKLKDIGDNTISKSSVKNII